MVYEIYPAKYCLKNSWKAWKGEQASAMLITLFQTTNFTLFTLKKFADDNIIYDENGLKFFKWVKKTVGKGEIARYEQFLPFPQCFEKTCTADI